MVAPDRRLSLAPSAATSKIILIQHVVYFKLFRARGPETGHRAPLWRSHAAGL